MINLQNIHAVSEIVGALATVVIAWLVFSYSRKRESLELTASIQRDWQQVNVAVLSSEELLAIEAKLHPFGALDVAQARSLFRHFLILNVAFSAWASRGHFSHDALAQSTVRDAINIVYKDREFVRNHVLPRGYPAEFAKIIEDGWAEIERTGSALIMA